MKSRRKIQVKTVVLVLIFISGIALMIYPTFSNWWNQKHAGYNVSNYTQSVEKLDPDMVHSLFTEAEAYNEKLLQNSARFFPDDSQHEEYSRLLSIEGSNIIGSVEIPSVEIDFPIYHGTSAEVLNIGVGHLEGSSLPIGGETCHCVLSGHRGLPSMQIFDRVPELINGDQILLHVLDKTFTYEVDGQDTVDPDNTTPLDFEWGEDRLTLITCTPYGINTHRLLIFAHRIENAPEAGKVYGSTTNTHPDPGFFNRIIAFPIIGEIHVKTMFILGLAFLLLVLFVLILHWRKNREKR